MTDFTTETPPVYGGFPTVARGKVAKAPASASDPITVTLVEYSNVHDFDVPAGQWATRGFLPATGDQCIVTIDDHGDAWVPLWGPPDPPPPPPPPPSAATVSGIDLRGVGIVGSKRAGRVLTVADFTTLLGISAPIALYNLDNAGDSSGNGRNLTPTTAPVTTTVGITGAANEAARFVGNNAAALFIADGNGGPFNFRTGSFGCWFKTAKTATSQRLLAKGGNSAGNRSWALSTDGANDVVKLYLSTDGTNLLTILGTVAAHDDRWHFAVGTYDGQIGRLYVDGDLDGAARLSSGGDLAQHAQPFNIGNAMVNAVAGTGSENFPMFGPIDEAFVHPEVLDLEQVRLLMAASVPHGLTSEPSSVSVKAHRRRRGGPLATTDFPATPRRLYNFTNTALTDQGADNVSLTASGTITSVDGMDGASRDAKSFPGVVGQYLQSSAVPAAFTAAARSIGCWFQTIGTGAQMTVLALTGGTGSDWRPLYIQATGTPATWDGTGLQAGQTLPVTVTDGLPHFWVTTWDNGDPSGLKRKIYLDGRLVGSDTSFTTPTVGTSGFYVGQLASSEPYKGLLDGLFVCDYALTPEAIAVLFAVGSKALPSALFDASIVEAADATNLYLLAHHLDPQHLLDLKVAA